MGIFKEVNKNSKSKKAKNKRPVSPMPSPVEVAPDAVPMPEAWGGPKSLEELFQPKPLKQTPPQQSPKQTAKPAAQQKRKKEEISVSLRRRSPPRYYLGRDTSTEVLREPVNSLSFESLCDESLPSIGTRPYKQRINYQ